MNERDTATQQISAHEHRRRLGMPLVEPRDDIPLDDKLGKLYEMARDCPVVAQCLGMYRAGRWSLNDALFHAVEHLSAQNKSMQKYAIEVAMRMPSNPFLIKAP